MKLNNTTTFIVVLLVIAIVGWVAYIVSVAPKVTSHEESSEVNAIPLDDASAVSAGLLGKWQSLDDVKFVREFKADGTAIDMYENQSSVRDTWAVFTASAPLTVPFPIEAGAVYVQMTSTGDTKETLNFKVSKLTADELELIYMDRGGVLRFTRVEPSTR